MTKLNKAEVLFMYDHADEQTRRVMVESLLDRMETLEREDVPNAEVKTFLDRIGWKTKTSASEAHRTEGPSADTKSES